MEDSNRLADAGISDGWQVLDHHEPGAASATVAGRSRDSGGPGSRGALERID